MGRRSNCEAKKNFKSKTNSINLDDSLKPNSLNQASTVE